MSKRIIWCLFLISCYSKALPIEDTDGLSKLQVLKEEEDFLPLPPIASDLNEIIILPIDDADGLNKIQILKEEGDFLPQPELTETDLTNNNTKTKSLEEHPEFVSTKEENLENSEVVNINKNLSLNENNTQYIVNDNKNYVQYSMQLNLIRHKEIISDEIISTFMRLYDAEKNNSEETCEEAVAKPANATETEFDIDVRSSFKD